MLQAVSLSKSHTREPRLQVQNTDRNRILLACMHTIERYYVSSFLLPNFAVLRLRECVLKRGRPTPVESKNLTPTIPLASAARFCRARYAVASDGRSRSHDTVGTCKYCHVEDRLQASYCKRSTSRRLAVTSRANAARLET